MYKILAVDDANGWRNFHNTMLNQIFDIDVQVDVANSAREGYDIVYNNMNAPYDLIISDLQMEADFEPKYAGEWFIEQVKMLKAYMNTRIVIVSACYNIRTVAENLNVDYIPKPLVASKPEAYETLVKKCI